MIPSPPPSPTRPRAPQPGSLVCDQCGYDLAATADTAACPECGLAVYISIERRHARAMSRALHPLAKAAVVVAGLGAVVSVIGLAYASGWTAGLLVLLFMVWNASPFLAIATVAAACGRRGWTPGPSIALAMFVVAVAALGFQIFVLAAFFGSASAQAGLIFVFAPIYMWGGGTLVGSVIVGVCTIGASWRAHVRRSSHAP